MGFSIEKDQIFTSLIAARDFIQKEQLKPHLMLEDAALEDFKEVMVEFDNHNKGIYH